MKIRHIILSISLLFMGLFITSCTDCSGDACLHNNNSWIVEKQSTCLQNGIRKKQCLDCKKIFKTETISKLEHQFEWIIDIEPTNEDEGLKHLECIQCHTIKDNTSIVSLSHVHEATHVLENKPTCTKDGNIEYYYCKTCNKYFTDSTLENEIAKDDTIKKATHELAFYKGQEATCFESGYNDYYTCLNCDYTTYQEIKPLGHEYQNEKCIRCQIEQFLYFGEYPQTLKEESVTIITDTPDDTGYYLGSDNNRYAKVVATPYNDSTYFNDKTTIVEGNIYYFKVEPIKWDVLEKNNQEYRLFSHLILDNQIFHNTFYDVLYQSSDIRNWLNNDFYNKAFTTEQQQYIKNTLVLDRDFAPSYDKIALATYDDMHDPLLGYKYYESGLGKNYTVYFYDAFKQLSDYSKALGSEMDISEEHYNFGNYWLNTINGYTYVYCNKHTKTSIGLSQSHDKQGIAPMITINYQSLCEQHQESDWIIDKDSTCSNVGLKHKECIICKDILETEEIDIHHIIYHEKVEVTCTKEGHEAFEECTNCSYTTDRYLYVIEPIGHNWINKECKNCGETILNVYHDELYDYMYFGEYPQTLKKNDISIISLTPNEKGYYLGSDNEYYAKSTTQEWIDPMGHFPFNNFNDGSLIEEGTTYYFKVEPIKWYILEESNNTYTLFSTASLDHKSFYNSFDANLVPGKTIYSNNYEYSDLRKWLNNEFYNKAFNEEEQNHILTSFVDNSINSVLDTYNPYLCESTFDKIYIPSIVDVSNPLYGFASLEEEDIKREFVDSDYGKTLIMWSGNEMMLRSPYHYSNYFYIYSLNYSGFTSAYLNGIVPMIRINKNTLCNEHQLSDWILDLNPSCYLKGFKHKECVNCKEIVEIQEIDSINAHDITHYDELLPTCSVDGYKAYDECKRCGYTTYEKINALGHNFVDNQCTRCLLIQIFETDGKYMYVGEYPQTLKDENITIINDVPDEKGYYLGSDNERYAKRGSYYFKVEPIKWEILEENDGVYKLISTAILDLYIWCNYFYDSYDYFTDRNINKDTIIYGNNYEYSDIRRWLNTSFYDIAFSDEEHNYMHTILVDNSLASTKDESNPYICNDTYDKITIPSVSEISQFSSLKRVINDYIKFDSYNNYCKKQDDARYFLRSPYPKYSGWFYDVWFKNEYYYYEHDSIEHNYASAEGVVPMIIINLNNNCKSHSESDWIIDMNNTCFSDGYKHKECTICHKVLDIEIIQKEHIYIGHDGVKPTCLNDGYEPYETCLNCDYRTYKKIKALNHNFIDGECTTCHIKENSYIIKDGDYVYFGEYPQTIKDDSVKIISDTPDVNGYYLGSDNNKYAKVVAQPLKDRNNIEFEFDLYFTNTTQMEVGTTYYFKVEPIKWEILSTTDGNYQLLSTLILDTHQWWKNGESGSILIDEKLIEPNDYEYSGVRQWLNNEFYNQAFNNIEQSYINTTLVDNSEASMGLFSFSFGFNNTYDKVYLPSESDMYNKHYGLNFKESRMKLMSDYVKTQGISIGSDYDYINNLTFDEKEIFRNYYSYYLRTPHNTARGAIYYITEDGDDSYGYTYNGGITPMLTLSFDRSCLAHSVEHLEYTSSTCTKDGNYECYRCLECDKYYSDETCKNELQKEDILIKASHNVIHHEKLLPTCLHDGYEAYDECINCDYSTFKKLLAHGHHFVDEKCDICGSVEGVTIDGKYLYMGEYPQSLKTDDVTIVSSTPNERGYFKGSDDNYYAKLNEKYFKVEPIKWEIIKLSDGTYQLLSLCILDNQCYFDSTEKRMIDGQTIYANNYEYSDIRNWLNNEFYNKAFSEIVKSYIIKTLVKNKEENNPYQSNDLLDYVYLPSIDEMTNYEFGYTLNGQEYDLLRQKQLTDYAKEKGCFASSGKSYNNGYYWLRTPLNCDDYYTHYVSFNGYIYSDKIITCDYIGVVPGLVITIE